MTATSSSRPAYARPAGLVKTPAGGGLDADSSPSAGARTWTIELPAGMKLLSQNSRLNRFEHNRRAQVLKKAAWALALQAKMPRLDRVTVVVEYQPGDNRDRDADNVPPASGKPCIDGLVAARVLEDDNRRHVLSVRGEIGPVHPRGRIVLHVTDATAETAAGAA